MLYHTWDLTTCGIPDQGLNLHPLHWKCSLNHWTTREVPCVAVFADDHTQKPRASRALDLYLELYWERRELSATYSVAQPCGSLCRFTLSCFLVSVTLGPLSLLWSTCLSHSSLLQSIFLASLNRVSKPAYPSLEAMSSYSATGKLGRGVLCLLNTLGKWNCCFIAQLCLTLATSWAVAPLSVGFRRQEYWSGLPFPSPWKVKYGLDFRQTHCTEENLQTFSETCVRAYFQISVCSLWESPGTDSAESLIVSCLK